MNSNRLSQFPICVALVLTLVTLFALGHAAEPSAVFNRAPLYDKPYAELPLGAIKPEGWLRAEMETMAKGLTGHLDELYPSVIGERNGWLGGDGDGWERGPYWIDGALPLAHQIGDQALLEKVNRWVEWTLNNQREDGYIGPIPFESPPKKEPGLQRDRRRDWWPKMVMLKILKQHYMATGDKRVLTCLDRYFRFQLAELPKTPLNHWSFWADRRGADNLLIVYWLYNLTGDKYLLELGELISKQTHPYTDIFLNRKKVKRFRHGGREAFHCVNLAQGIKTPIVCYQADADPKHLKAIEYAFEDIEQTHGQPHGLYGGDEGMHGKVLTQGSELCTAVEMMYSLEKMLEITGNLDFADRLEMIAFNLLPSQISDDQMTRQYFQQANQIACTRAVRNFFDDHGTRTVFGLISGYPCCTCNLHQGWPKFTQHLWMATAKEGLAALTYAPCKLTTTVAGKPVTITESTFYPFEDRIRFAIQSPEEIAFPLQLRVPSWCNKPSLALNGEPHKIVDRDGNLITVERTWNDGDELVLSLPAKLRSKRWHENSVSLYRGPLLFGLEIGEIWSENGHGEREVRAKTPWNYALIEQHVKQPAQKFIVEKGEVSDRPWSLASAPLRIVADGIPHALWKEYNESTGPIPWSPQVRRKARSEKIRLIPLWLYGVTNQCVPYVYSRIEMSNQFSTSTP